MVVGWYNDASTYTDYSRTHKGGGIMTPIMDDSLYGIKYDCRRYCPKCKLADWYDLKDTEYILCLKCGYQEPL